MITLWDAVKNIYYLKHGIPTDIIDLIAVKEILFKCVTGYSTEDISMYMQLSFDYVNEVLEHYFNFGGWTHSLQINPYPLYDEDFQEFKNRITEKDFFMEDEEIIFSHYILSLYKTYERRLEHYGY